MYIAGLYGNINYIGYVSDHIFYQNQLNLWSILWCFRNDDESIKEYLDTDNSLIDLKIFYDYRKFIESLVFHSLHDVTILEYIYKFEIDKLIFMLLGGNTWDFAFFHEEIINITIIDKDILQTIKSLWNDSQIPDLSNLFLKWLPEIQKSLSGNGLPSDNNFQINIKYFNPMNKSIFDKAQGVFKNITQSDDLMMKPKDKIFFSNEFGFELTNDEIKVDSLRFIKAMLQCIHKDLNLIGKIVKMVTPLYQKIPEANALINSIFFLSKERYHKIFNVMPVLVKLILISRFEQLKEDYEKKKIEFKLSDNLVNSAVGVLNCIIIMLYKNKYFFSMSLQRSKIVDMLIALQDNEKDFNSGAPQIKEIQKLADFILLILGLGKFHLELVKNFANQIGWFDKKATDLFNIFWKYKEVVFRNGVSNIPKFSKKLISESLRSAVNLETSEINEQIKKALNDGTKDVINIAKENVANLSKAAKEQMKKVIKMTPENIGIKCKYLQFAPLLLDFYLIINS